MNEVILPRKRQQQIFNVQMIFALIVTILEMIPKLGHTAGNIFQLVFLCLVIGLNFYIQFKRKNPSKLNHEITRWITLWLFSGYFIDVWLATVIIYYFSNFFPHAHGSSCQVFKTLYCLLEIWPDSFSFLRSSG